MLGASLRITYHLHNRNLIFLEEHRSIVNTRKSDRENDVCCRGGVKIGTKGCQLSPNICRGHQQLFGLLEKFT